MTCTVCGFPRWRTEHADWCERVTADLAALVERCQRGHEWVPENTYTPPGTTIRQCRTCILMRREIVKGIRGG